MPSISVTFDGFEPVTVFINTKVTITGSEIHIPRERTAQKRRGRTAVS